MLEVRLLVRAWDDVVRARLLVGGDVVGVVDGGERLAELGHVRLDLALEVVVEHLGALHGLVEGQAGDVPTAKDKVVGMDHGEDVRDGDVNVAARGRVNADGDGGGAEHGADVVGLLHAALGAPGDVVAVGEHGGAKRRTVVASHADHHEARTISQCDERLK